MNQLVDFPYPPTPVHEVVFLPLSVRSIESESWGLKRCDKRKNSVQMDD